MLSVKLAKMRNGWLWRSDTIGSTLEVGLGCFGVFVVEKVQDKMVSIAGGWESIAWCGLLLWVVAIAKVERVLAPFSAWFQGKLGNLWCGGWFHCRATCITGVSLCIGLGHDRIHDLELCPFSCMGAIFGRRSLGFFPAEMVRNSSPSSLVARNCQNRCYAQAWG
jgi:hypothetical protein